MFDRQHQYVLAEATRTLSLQQDDLHDEKDELWLGTTTLRRNAAPCEYGAGLRVSEDVEQEHAAEGATWFDLTTEPFSKISCVLGYPFARFYAGVPIVSPDGFNIGVYSIMDDRPRQGLTKFEVKFLKDMASTVMEHLKMIRATDELRKSQNMVTGLGSFVDGRSGLGDLSENRNHRQPCRRNRQSTLVKGHLSQRSKDGVAPLSKDNVRRLERMHRNNNELEETPLSNTLKGPQSGRYDQGVTCPASNQSKHPQEDSLLENVRSTFQRATDILREALELDGAMILDASVNTSGGLTTKASRENMASSSAVSVTTPILSNAYHVSSTPSIPKSKPCIVLGNSSLAPIDSPEVGGIASPSPMTEFFLHSLLEKYPKGKIWSFDDEEDGSEAITLKSDVEPAISTYRHDEINRKGNRWIERRTIRQLLPGVRSLVFVGMWDHHRDRWFAGSILWSYDPTRVLSHSIELNYSIAFGQSLMVEVARLDARMADRMKGTFISSISHELSTPLHGIMGSSECLQATNMDAGQSDLVATIETCGKTLLDTFDNLIAFTKVNRIASRITRRRCSTTSTLSAASQDSTKVILSHAVNLGTLIEEVVEASFAGHRALRINRNKSIIANDDVGGKQYSGSSHRDHVSVILDYPDLTSQDWICKTQPGAWRRLILNLLGNSLKYTEKGSVTIKLEKDPIVTGGHREIVLTVADTGKGMSSMFLETRAFVPFAQEDSLTSGTGLGLSIVKQLVESMDGHVSVKSKKDEGTEVRVAIPVEPCREVDAELILAPISGYFRNSQISVIVDRAPSHHENERASLASVFAMLCSDWFDMTVTIDTELIEADFHVTTEEYVEALAEQAGPSKSAISEFVGAPLIVVCQDVTMAQAARKRTEAFPISTDVEYVSQP